MPIKSRTRQKKIRWKRGVTILLILVTLLSVGLLLGLKYYRMAFAPTVNTGVQESYDLYIPSNGRFDEVVAILELSGVVTDLDGFVWLAQRKGYPLKVKGGKYILRSGMSNNELVNMLRAGRQSPVNVTFNNIRTVEELSGQLAKRLEPDSMQFLKVLTDPQLLKPLGFEPSTILAMIIPNSYQVFWNTPASGFLSRMQHEYNQFWNAERSEKANKCGLSKLEVSILASIVDEETIKEKEKPLVAGLYLNRLKIGMRLQADPTIKFAMGDFTVTRILTRDLAIDSPYNTYLNAGLPPGPIRMPSISGIDGVLNHEGHNYLYMCAKEDFSGYHNFARTLAQHNQNAARYRNALRRLRIYR